MSSTSDIPFITSPQNPHVKELVDLRKDGELRRKFKRFLLEGRRAVGAALALDHALIHEFIYCEHLLEEGPAQTLLAQAQKKGIPLLRVTKDVFKKIADVITPQGVAAVVQMPEWTLDQILGRDRPLVLAACGIQDPGNLGTLIRSAEAAGASGLLALEGTADPFNTKVVRSTAGALLNFPIVRMRREEFLEVMSARHLRLVAATAQGGKLFRSFDWKARPLVLCIGSEGEGLPPDIEAACREKVTIPLSGQAESLNAAVAASILLFEAQAKFE